jgi:formate dehydrogenase assembly factor FdhD
MHRKEWNEIKKIEEEIKRMEGIEASNGDNWRGIFARSSLKTLEKARERLKKESGCGECGREMSKCIKCREEAVAN